MLSAPMGRNSPLIMGEMDAPREVETSDKVFDAIDFISCTSKMKDYQMLLISRR